MKNKFVSAMSNLTQTENKALTHKTTENPVLDFFYHAAARRGQDNTQIFADAFNSDPVNATLALFYTRDIRGGQGERKTFRDCLNWLKLNQPMYFNAIVPLVAEYGRWDDLLIGVSDSDVVVETVLNQFRQDQDILQSSKGTISLLAKWMPSINTSSNETRQRAKYWMNLLGMDPKTYRVTLARMRAHLKIVERDLTSKNYSNINYSQVPSKANLLYRKAFKKHDNDRYSLFLQSVLDGKTKMNSATNYPHDIVGKYLGSFGRLTGQLDQSIEALWKSLPNYVTSENKAIVVADTSGSMYGVPLQISLALAIYFGERNVGDFKDVFITFSEKPTFHSLKGKTLYEKLKNLDDTGWDMNTNLQATFDLILGRAVASKVDPSDMPNTLFIVSDMEFDTASRSKSKTNFEKIREKYAKAGYTMPKLVFWNVSSRNTQTPVTQKEEGVYLLSGASPVAFKYALESRVSTPYDLMLEILNKPRYEPVKKAVSNLRQMNA